MATLRTISFGLIITGLSGAALFHLQSRPRIAPGHVQLVAQHDDSRSRARTRSKATDGFDRDAAEFIAAIAAAASPRRTTSPNLAASPDATSDDLDLSDPELRVPLARLALAAVGMDDQAEAFWLRAINDPTVDARDRKDLIEDLNEDGFPDPKHPTKEDLPLIEARIALIDRLAPIAMDATNTDALTEARKNLLAMRELLVQPTSPSVSPPAVAP